MLRQPKAPAILAMGVVTALLAAGCGSSGAVATASARPTSAPAATAAPGATAAPQATEQPSDSSGGQPGTVNSGIPTITTGIWSKGTMHIEISRDRSGTFDLPGGMIGTSGVGIGTYVDAATKVNSSVTLSGTDESGFFLNTPDIVTAGAFGKECQVKITKNDASGVEGEFTCSNLDALKPGTSETFHIDARVTFTAHE